MGDAIQFIIESPQHSSGQKKRPRLVTSCDNCRLKKIKCIQPNPEAKCEACKGAKIPCHFKDREKYFAERSRAIQSPQEQRPSDASASSSPTVSHHDLSRHSSHSPKTATGLVAPDMDYARYQPYPSGRTQNRHAGVSPITTTFHARSNSGNSSMEYQYSPQVQHSMRLQLFDPDHPFQPHPHLLQQFIPLFFEQYGRDYPFLIHQDIFRSFLDKRLPPILANCIAALACRHHSNPDLATTAVEMAYSTQAKQILAQQPPSQKQSLHMLQALVLLGWYDYSRNQFDGFRNFTQLAIQLGLDMHLPEYKFVTVGEQERNIPPLTWAHVVNMQQTLASTTRGTPVASRIF